MLSACGMLPGLSLLHDTTGGCDGVENTGLADQLTTGTETRDCGGGNVPNAVARTCGQEDKRDGHRHTI